ncbi:hypothetical protein ACO2Q9_03630 [Variovorax sp. VNK109]|uniref:hypothetical protein n=1 Tax=Variovorax sp. VNK109 TaxID=3400919 RepID=UPI003C0E6AFC
MEFPPRSAEAVAGRIPSCIERLNLGEQVPAQLLALFESDFTFKAEEISKLGWTGIDAETDGQMEDDDELLLASMLSERGIRQVLASSRRDLRKSASNSFLGARLVDPTKEDLACLRLGFWTRSGWSDILKPLDLLWLGWEVLFCFTWPLQFGLIQLGEGEGHTTLVGPPDFINEFRRRSNPDHWYQWKPWGLPLPPDYPPKAT